MNLDSFHEIERLRKNRPIAGGSWKVGLSLNGNLERHCPGETAMSTEPGRFGFSLENGSFYEAARQIKALDYMKIAGVHTHHSSGTKSMGAKPLARSLPNLSSSSAATLTRAK